MFRHLLKSTGAAAGRPVTLVRTFADASKPAATPSAAGTVKHHGHSYPRRVIPLESLGPVGISFPNEVAIPHNKYILGLSNYREAFYTRFRADRTTMAVALVFAIAVPAAVWFSTAHGFYHSWKAQGFPFHGDFFGFPREKYGPAKSELTPLPDVTAPRNL